MCPHLPLDLPSFEHTNEASCTPKCWSHRFRAQGGSFSAAFYLKARVKLPRIPSTLIHFAVLRHGKDSEKLMMIPRREKAQGWELISISCLLWLFHISMLSTFTLSMAQAFIRNLPSAGEAVAQGQPGWEPS